MKGVYPHANTVVCIEDSKLLKQFQYDILFHAQGLQATLDELNSINYFRTYQSAETHNYGAMLDGLMGATFKLMREISPEELIWRIFALYYDIHNMKLVAKERLMGKKLDRLAIGYGSYTLPTIRSAAVRESDNILNDDVLTKGFFEALRSKSLYDIDFILDRAYFRTLRCLVEKLGIPGVVEFVIEKADLFNVSALAQWVAAGKPEGYFAKAFSDQGAYPLPEWEKYIYGNGFDDMGQFPLWHKYENIWKAADDRNQLFSELDVLIDNYLIGKTKPCKLIALGIEPICGYFFNKFMEIKNIRILLRGKESGYGTGEIKKRMRAPYEL